MMRPIRMVATFSLLLVPVAAPAAEWDPGQITVSPSEDNATLGVSGRTAAVDDLGQVHLVFQKNLDGEHFQIWCSIRTSTGTWSEAEIVSDPVRNARNPSVAIDPDGNFHVVWEDITDGEGNIVHRVRDTAGIWGGETFVSPAPGFSKKPVIAVDAFNRRHVVWIDGRNNVQRLLHSTQAPGDDWTPAEVLSVEGVAPEDANIDVDGLGRAHVVWTDRGASDKDRFSFDIHYVRLDPEGGIIAPVRLIDHPGIAMRPFLEVLDDGTLHLVWLDNRATSRSGTMEIFYKRYLPGIGWGNDKRFSYDETDHGRPVIVSGARGTMNIAWEDYRAGTPDIFYRQITWETGWDRDPTQLTSDVSASQAPTLLATPGGGLMVFWTDAQGPGNFRVFAKEGTVGTP